LDSTPLHGNAGLVGRTTGGAWRSTGLRYRRADWKLLVKLLGPQGEANYAVVDALKNRYF
jgi:hypothetical protein